MTHPQFDSMATEPFQPAPPEPGPVPPAPVSVQPVRAGGAGGSRVLNLALGAALLVGAVGISFAAGRVTAPSAATTGAPGGGSQPGGFGGNGGFGNGGFGNGFPGGNGYFPGGFPGDDDGGFRGGLRGVNGGLTIQGTVTAVSGSSVTVKLASGATVTIGLDSNTAYHQQASATAADVQAGKSVILRLANGFRPDGGTSGTVGTASDVTVVP